MSSLNQYAEKILTTIPSIAAVQQELDDNDEEIRLLKLSLPKGIDVQDALEFGFYEYKHRYWIRRQGDRWESVSNFTMKVHYLIVGANPKRIVEIKNVYGKHTTLDFAIEDLISLEKFKGRVESVGNFLFEGKPSDLLRIKAKLFNNEQPSIEITRLGQYKSKFWAWANGIYHGQAFLPVDDRGMVDVDGEHYYIPVFGSTRADDDEDLRNYRRFLHRESNTTFEQWASLFCQVYGDNGRVGLAFYLFTLFSDVIFERTKAAPMLFLFGQRGSGKGTMAQSLLAMFGVPQDQIMLGGASTVVGFMRKLGQFSNAMVWLDEYKNDIGERKIESLKNIWDRVGYERGVKDSSNKTQSTPVTSTAIISGQEIPTVEPALFSRTVFCDFKVMQFTQEEVNLFNQLRDMEENGITNATLEVLSLREHVAASFPKYFQEITTVLRSAFLQHDIIERQIINYSILIATTRCVQERLKVPFDYAELIIICERYLIRQRDMMRTSNEVQQFFEMTAFLLSVKEIEHEKDLYICQGLIKIRPVTIIPLYREYSTRQRLKPLDRGTLTNYLTNSPAYCEKETKQGSHRFPLLQSPTNAMVFLQTSVKDLYGIDFNEILQDVENQQDSPKSGDKPLF